jgi:hypothetical protein
MVKGGECMLNTLRCFLEREVVEVVFVMEASFNFAERAMIELYEIIKALARWARYEGIAFGVAGLLVFLGITIF